MSEKRRAYLAEQALGRLNDVLTDAHFDWIPNFGRGKVRDWYDLDQNKRILISTDRQSAFDHILAAVPFKGQVLNGVARFGFEATADIIPNHVIAFPDPNVTVCKRLDMISIEIVVRAFLTGSTSTALWPKYQQGERHLYGHKLPDGLNKNDMLPTALITPTTKGDNGAHDRPLSAADILTEKLLTQKQWEEIEAAALDIFARGQEVAKKRGLILVDTKYEFGYDKNGRLTLADEVHTPDSSRYWHASSYDARHAENQPPEHLDKEFLRLWVAERCDPYKDPIPPIEDKVLADFSARYIELYEKLTGNEFIIPPRNENIKERVEENLRKYITST